MAVIKQNAGVGADTSRFASLLAGGVHTCHLYDRVLTEVNGCVITPTLGSIIPNWLLIIPREPVLNFAHWHTNTLVNPADLVRNFLNRYNISADRAVWFEHGPAKEKSKVGCGLDHAHLHVLIDAPFSFESFMKEIYSSSNLHWKKENLKIAYSSINNEQSYLVVASLDNAFISQNVEEIGSQYLRRVVAKLADSPCEWNYKTHHHLGNIQKTIQNFECRER